jgi:hypothetical protein
MFHVLMALMAGALTSLALAADMPCGGLNVRFDGSGRVTGLAVAGRSVLDPVGVPASGFAVWDHARDKGFVGFSTRMYPNRDGWRFVGEQDGLRLVASFRKAGSGYAVEGSVRRTGGDRFLSVRFGLPVDVEGWRWWRTIGRSLGMRVGRDRQNGMKTGLGIGFSDILPMAAASGPRVTIGYTVPMDRQLLHTVLYDGATRNLGIVFDFALCQAVPRHADRVNFAFEVFAPADPSGLRAIVAEYFARYPQWGQAPQCPPGGWCAWGDIGQHQAPLCDFGLLYHEGPTPSGQKTCQALGIRDLPYIEPSMYQQFHGDLQRAPTADEAWARLRHTAEAPLDQIVSAGSDEAHRRWVQAISRGILESPVCAGEGKPIAPNPGNWPWIGGSNYGVQFPLNLSPGIYGGVGQERLGEVAGMVRGQADGQYLDSYSAWLTTVDYSTRNLNASRFPPSFDDRLHPATILAMPAMEWVDEVRQLLGLEQQCILPNCYDLNAPFPWHQFDVIGKEMWVDPVGDMMANCRAMGMHKTVTQLPAYGADPEPAWFKRFLLYDVLPGGYANTGKETPAQLRAIYRRLIPPLRLLHALQWQPRTAVTCAETGVLVERYGQGPGPVAVVAVNNGPAGKVTLQVEGTVAGLPREAWCQDPMGESRFDWTWSADRLTVSTWLGEGDTALCVITDKAAQARLWELWAQDRISDINLCMREYAMRQGRPHELAPQAAALMARANPEAVKALQEFAAAMPAGDPVPARAGQLAKDAADRLATAIAGKPMPPEPVRTPEGGVQTVTPESTLAQLPWAEEFDKPVDPAVWKLSPSSGMCEVRDGKLWMELKSATGVAAECLKTFSMTGGPVELEFSFQYNCAEGWWYLGDFITIGFGGDHILIRVDNARQIRLENAWTAACGYTQPIVDYMPIAPNMPHVLRLDVGTERYQLIVDDKLLSEGYHEVEVGPTATLSIGQYSGHQGHGDVAWMDYVKVKRLAPEAMKPAR